MTIQDTNFDNQISHKWKILCKIHGLTKKYTLLAEEYSIDMKTYIQPIKEQKDAYEHITRAYEKLYTQEEKTDDVFEYVLKNLDKALSHEFRAFYDTMDYVSIVLREIFYNELKDFNYREIIAVYPEYKNIKQKLLKLPSIIAEQRNNKDIGLQNPVNMAEEYCNIVEDLFNIYKDLFDNIFKNIKLN